MDPNSANVSEAFSKQSVVFDTLYKENRLSEYLRSHFRKEVLAHLKPNGSVLELNCGTGMDAIYFAEKGHTILATDNAPGMLAQLDRKIQNTALGKSIRTRRCSFHDIHTIAPEKFDHILSNFGGLNCTDNLRDVLEQFSPLLNDRGKVTLMVMPKICPWELVMMFKGKFKTAFRRFKKNTPAHIEGVHFFCYYYNPGYIKAALEKDFDVITLKGIFITVPPEFYQNFVERYPKLFSLLCKIDSILCRVFPFTYCCDHYMITLQKK
jgi:ubiquinone/menaquinone biosynthesis C-methylase UbiE